VYLVRFAHTISVKKCAFVTAVPARKKVPSSAKNTLHGWTAWMTAVRKAVAMPIGVRDFRDQALYTRAAVAGTAIIGFIVDCERGRQPT